MARTATCASTRSSRNGSRAATQKYLPKLISGEHVGALAMSEPGAGSDVDQHEAAGRRTRAATTCSTAARCGSPTAPTPTPGGLRQDRTRAGRARRHRLSRSRRACKGFSIAQKLDKLGMRGSHTGELVFDNVRGACDQRAGRREQRRQGADERPGLRARGAHRRAAGHHAGGDGQRRCPTSTSASSSARALASSS